MDKLKVKSLEDVNPVTVLRSRGSSREKASAIVGGSGTDPEAEQRGMN